MSELKPPRWVQRVYLEWLYRLVSEPRHLATRYTYEAWAAAFSNSERPRAEPSRLAEKLLYLFLPKEQREHVPGDLEEEFTTIILPKFGPRFARFWYWWQVIRSIIFVSRFVRLLTYAGGATGIVKSVEMLLSRWGVIGSDQSPSDKD